MFARKPKLLGVLTNLIRLVSLGNFFLELELKHSFPIEIFLKV